MPSGGSALPNAPTWFCARCGYSSPLWRYSVAAALKRRGLCYLDRGTGTATSVTPREQPCQIEAASHRSLSLPAAPAANVSARSCSRHAQGSCRTASGTCEATVRSRYVVFADDLITDCATHVQEGQQRCRGCRCDIRLGSQVSSPRTRIVGFWEPHSLETSNGSEGRADEGPRWHEPTDRGGGGAGFGIRSVPVGVFTVKDGNVSWHPSRGVNTAIASGVAALITIGWIVRAALRQRAGSE
jgi:hypothetical protein